MTKPGARLSTDIERDPIHLAAAEWLVRLQGAELSLEETLAWQAWLAESPDNAHAFARMEEVSQALRAVPVPRALPATQVARDRYDASVPLKDWVAHRTSARQSVLPAPRRILSVLAVAASVAIAAVTLALWTSVTPNSYSTAIGEHRTVALSDGSTIALGADTQIDVRLSKDVRAIELIRGEALFKVAKDAARPFKVRAGEATVTAVGTAFNIERDSDRAVVSVTEGRVVVEPVVHFLPVAVLHGFEPKQRSVRLQAGQQTTAGKAGIEEPTKMDDSVAGWQTGRLAFRLQPLRYVLEDVNRYAAKPIVLDRVDEGALIITGTVERENIAGWVRSLERAFNLEATEETDQIVLRAR
jgi:transmembrane sensor